MSPKNSSSFEQIILGYGYEYEVAIRHEGLNKYRHIRGRDRRVVKQKARVQLAEWDAQWQKQEARRAAREEQQMEIEGRRAAREEKQLKIEARRAAREETKQIAQNRSEEAASIFESMKTVLGHTLRVNDAINWRSLKRNTLKKPDPAEPRFNPKVRFFDFLLPAARKKKLSDARNLYERELEHYKTALAEENAHNAAIDEQERRYRAKEPGAIEEHCDLVLSNSQYPDFMPKEYEVEFNPESRILVVEYRIPSLDDLPTLREVKYVQSRDALEEVHISDSERNKLYDDLIYQMCLRTIHELFEADVVDALASVVFNGWPNYIDRSTGRETRACIMSLHVPKETFLAINLAQVDPKACFRALKGVGSSKLHGMAPVAPIMHMNRSDRRFIESVAVAGRISEGTNLAAMDWQEFEHLIRELFEKEFASSGGEVRVTQASRDGGVDAVAFDPDPIRGGKIVIQAKRYTGTVGVAAVRELYGAVHNEGAIKGILVTTATYGPDAYEFAKDKPLTLVDGSNLLHLLARHGHRAHIDLKEAKRIAKEEAPK